MQAYLVDCDDSLKMAGVERLLSTHYARSLKAHSVTFDLNRVAFAGYYAATLLLSWGTHLLRRHIPVTILLPDRDALPHQPRKVLLQYGILQHLQRAGATVPYFSSPPPREGLSVCTLPPRDSFRSVLTQQADVLVRSLNLDPHIAASVRAAFDIVLFELGENAYHHADPLLAYYGVSVATSAGGSTSPSGVMHVYPAGTQYVEIFFGDAGAGIHSHLRDHMPADYTPPFPATFTFSTAERVLAFALEFSSTSDRTKRRARIAELVRLNSLDPAHVATGLFCVSQLARVGSGQLVMRTPGAMLSVDFAHGADNVTVKTASHLHSSGRHGSRPARLAPIPGTHYLVRLPLVSPPAASPQVDFSTICDEGFAVDLCDPFAGQPAAASLEGALDAAISAVDTFLAPRRKTGGLCIITPPGNALPSRAIAVLLAAFRSMPHGLRRLCWLFPQAAVASSDYLDCAPISQSSFSHLAQAVWVGSITRNSLNRGRLPSDATGATTAVALPAPLWEAVRRRYSTWLTALLKDILQTPPVRTTAGPFLIERKYYTKVFFQVSEALSDDRITMLFAQWVVLHVDFCPAVLIGESRTIEPLLRAIASAFEVFGFEKPAVLSFDASASPPRIIRETLDYVGQSAMLVTDVVCRGYNIKTFVSILPQVDLRALFVLVDARPGLDLTTDISVSSGNKSKLLPVKALLAESIEPYDDPPGRTKTDASGELVNYYESVAVIDRITHSPTIYTRHDRAQLAISDLLQGPVWDSRSLLLGHVEYKARHYSVFLDFRLLFGAIRPDLEEWLKIQLEFVLQVPGDSQPELVALVYDPDNTLDWIGEAVRRLYPSAHIRLVSDSDLRAPPRALDLDPDNRSTTFVAIVPALASGETARMCVEYAARQSPKDILLLSVVTRADAYLLTFFDKIQQYDDAKFHVARYMDFPACSYPASPSHCPLCQYHAQLEHLYTEAQRALAKDSLLLEAIARRVDTSRPRIFAAASAAVPILATAERELRVAHVRALYEAAGLQLPFRHELNKLLLDDKYLDALLEVISLEGHSQQFSTAELTLRLYSAREPLIQRALTIIDTSLPPFEIGRVVGALLFLVPSTTLDSLGKLLLRFADSPPDVEDLLVAVLASGLQLPTLGEVLTELRNTSRSAAEQLVSDAAGLSRDLSSSGHSAFTQTVERIQKLWSALARSMPFKGALSTLAVTPTDRYESNEEMLRLTEELERCWRSEISTLVSQVTTTKLWRYLLDEDPMLTQHFASVDRLVSGLLSAAGELRRTSTNSQLFRSPVQQLAKELSEASLALGKFLFELFFSPLHCEVAELPLELAGPDGVTFEVTKRIDYDVPKIFAFRKQLDYACNQIVENWIKHGGSLGVERKVWFNLYARSDYVVFEFGDHFGGRFKFESRGGLSYVSQFANAYGGSVEDVYDENGVQKSVRICLPAIRRPPE